MIENLSTSDRYLVFIEVRVKKHISLYRIRKKNRLIKKFDKRGSIIYILKDSNLSEIACIMGFAHECLLTEEAIIKTTKQKKYFLSNYGMDFSSKNYQFILSIIDARPNYKRTDKYVDGIKVLNKVKNVEPDLLESIYFVNNVLKEFEGKKKFLLRAYEFSEDMSCTNMIELEVICENEDDLKELGNSLFAKPYQQVLWRNFLVYPENAEYFKKKYNICLNNHLFHIEYELKEDLINKIKYLQTG